MKEIERNNGPYLCQRPEKRDVYRRLFEANKYGMTTDQIKRIEEGIQNRLDRILDPAVFRQEKPSTVFSMSAHDYLRKIFGNLVLANAAATYHTNKTDKFGSALLERRENGKWMERGHSPPFLPAGQGDI